MRRVALEVLACPVCIAPLTAVNGAGDPIESGSLLCTRGHAYEIASGVPLLVPEEDQAVLSGFSSSYADAWARDGWGNPDAEHLRNLPYADIEGRHKSEWRVKARSLDALVAGLDPATRLRIADMGCGVGWLSHHLARRGHEVYAVDVLLDQRVGLGAAAAYLHLGPYFERVCAELERAPFGTSTLDVVICNASLHYVAQLDATLAQFFRMLKPGGRVMVMNSPVCHDRESALKGQTDFQRRLIGLGIPTAVAARYHHFIRSELEGALQARIGSTQELAFHPGTWFQLSRRAKGIALGMELASFPILVATKPDSP